VGDAGRVSPPLEVLEFTDPACPWAWGSEPTFRRLRRMLGKAARFRRVFGILFDSDDDPAPDPAAETLWYHRHLAEISGHTGAPYPESLGWVTATSWPASMAATAAEVQGTLVADRVLRRLRETTFVLGRPADTTERVLAAVRGVPGLDPERLARDLVAPRTYAAVRRDRARTRDPLADVFAVQGNGPHDGRAKPVGDGYRYALPTLVFTGPAGRAVVPGWRALDEYVDAARRVAPGIPVRSGTVAGDWALWYYRSLSAVELPDGVPSGAVPVPTAGGPLWLHPDEARVHPGL
jgi:predicted DsbA family dithiol-disulfide isomerase